MKKHLLLLPCCLLAVSCQGTPSGVPGTTSSQLQTVAHSEKNRSSPENIARQITVRVNVGNRRGSGAIIAKRGNRYTILTNAHVANKSNTYQITTSDGKTHPAKCAQPLKQGTCYVEKNHDLALLEFTATKQYTAAEWGDSRNLKPGETIYSAGFPFEQTELKIDRGQIKLQTSKPLQGGYQIGYDLPTAQGMSGGSLLNANGQLIGIIGLSSEPILDGGYQYQDGSQPTADEVTALRRSSFAIPIAILAKLDTQYTAFLSKPNSGAMARAKYTGVVKRVDDIAEQITVRIEDKNGGNGSGVIVAKEGDTYYVVTAAHVVKDGAAAVVTPSQERIGLSDGEINIVNQDVDVAVVKFKSSQNYRIAEISKYEFNEQDLVFVSGFPGKDHSKQRHLTIGAVQDRNNALFVVKDSSEKDGSLSRGINLVYSNLSLPGMSGGAVLDRQGRLVGINTGAENEKIITQDYKSVEINFGYALGIPISTVLGVAQGKIPTDQLQVATTPRSKQSQSENRDIYEILLSTLTKPTQTASAKEWLDYANLLWRSKKPQESITAFEIAIKLLERNSGILDRKEQLRIAYYGLGLSWLENDQMSNDKAQRFKPAISAFKKATDIDPSFYLSWRYLGISLRNSQRYEEALIAYRTAIPKQSNDFVLYVEQGDILVELSRFSDAINSYTEAIKIKSNHPWIYLNRGLTYKRQKQYDRAMDDYARAIQLDSQLASPYLNRSNIFIQNQQYERAMDDCNRAIQINPLFAPAYMNRGVIYMKQKQYRQAIDEYNRAIQLGSVKPQLVMAYSNRGFAYKEQKQYDRAISDYNRAIQIDPQFATAYYNRGNVYADVGQYDKAIADFDRAISLYNDKFQQAELAAAYNDRGSIYGAKQQNDKAFQDYNRAIKLDPQLSMAYANRGDMYLKSQQYDNAMEDCNLAIKIDPQMVKAYFCRGSIYAEKQQDNQAMEDYNQVIKLGYHVPKVYYNLGIIYKKHKQTDRAIEHYSEAIKLNPKFWEAYKSRGAVYLEQKKYTEAMADYNRAIQLNPNDAEVYANRGNIYADNKQYSEAIADYNRAIQLNPTDPGFYYNRASIYFEQKQYSQAKADVKKAADLYRAQNNMGAYQQMMAQLEKLKSVP